MSDFLRGLVRTAVQAAFALVLSLPITAWVFDALDVTVSDSQLDAAVGAVVLAVMTIYWAVLNKAQNSTWGQKDPWRLILGFLAGGKATPAYGEIGD